MTQRPPSGIIFDVDGTLIDSVDLHAKAWQEAFSEFGHVIAFEDIRRQIGKGGDQLMPVFFDSSELDRIGEKLERFRTQVYQRKYLPMARAFPCVRSLFQRITDAGQRIALASSAKADELAIYKKMAQIEDLVSADTSADDAEGPSPIRIFSKLR
jgi:phosphoglycolate phosphatase-like HAD superfamily hydrolase